MSLCSLRIDQIRQVGQVYLAFIIATAMVSCAWSQTTITAIRPMSCLPNATTKLTIDGTKISSTLRLMCNQSQLKCSIDRVSENQAIVSVTAPADVPLGPFGWWIATDEGPLFSKILLMDDAPPVIDNGNNHSLASAQQVVAPVAVDGHCDGTTADYYRLAVHAGERIAFETHTQTIGSRMDPVIELLHADGRLIRTEDDTASGADCRFEHVFAEAGDYVLRISDSRYASGNAYYLRVGNFPILEHAVPMALPTEASLPSGVVTSYSERNADSNASAWVPILVSNRVQLIEESPETTDRKVPSIPIGIHGSLSEPSEIDRYDLQGTKGQSIRVATRARSLGAVSFRNYDSLTLRTRTFWSLKLANQMNAVLATPFPTTGSIGLKSPIYFTEVAWGLAIGSKLNRCRVLLSS
jgi:hypothetical protein